MISVIKSLSLLLVFFSTSAWAQSSLVNPFIGASTNMEKAGAAHGLGKTFPGAATPFGLVQLSPNTITGGDNGPGYSMNIRKLRVLLLRK